MQNNEIPHLNVSGLLRQFDLQPKKSLGQNFLVDTGSIRKVLDAAGIQPGDAVLEIGPGLGSLTLGLSLLARQVVAVELDQRLLPALEHVLQNHRNVQVVQGDILKLDPGILMGQDRYIVAANIPYYITSAVIEHLLEAPVRPVRMVITIQQEVAARICAKPGDMNQLALSVQVYGRPRITARIPAGAFFPTPTVDSAVVRIDLHPEPLIPSEYLPVFFRLAKAGFGQKRKTLRNSLSAGLDWQPSRTESLLASCGLDPKRRAETLDLAEWHRLTNAYREESG